MALAFVPIVSLRPVYTEVSLHPIVARIPGIVLRADLAQRRLPHPGKSYRSDFSSDLIWNSHVDGIVSKARKRMFLIYQLKRAGMGV